MNYAARPGFPADHATPQRDYAVWKARLEARLRLLWPELAGPLMGESDLHLVWRWQHGDDPERTAAQLVREWRSE